MAKDLPYFKFFVSEWNDGDITLEDYEVQGLFINLCSYYWSNECNLSFKKTMKKFKDADYDLFKALIDSDIIKVDGDELTITFLDEQQEERISTSKIKRKGGLASAEARRLKKLQQEDNTIPTENEHVLNSCSTETQLLREEKIREDKIRKTKEQLFLEDWNELRFKHLKKKSNIKMLSGDDKDNFKELSKQYNTEDFRNALIGLFKQKKLPNDNKVMQANPKHFLKYFNTYYTAYGDQNTALYGENKKEY